MNIIDQDGYETVKRPRRFVQFMPEIFAVDAEGFGDTSTMGDSPCKKPPRPKSSSICVEACPKKEKFTKEVHQRLDEEELQWRHLFQGVVQSPDL